jgi:Ca2+/Na+ antiporter
VVESILRLGKPAGELGPSTIVGSAAFNLMMIMAVCTVSLPTGNKRQCTCHSSMPLPLVSMLLAACFCKHSALATAVSNTSIRITCCFAVLCCCSGVVKHVRHVRVFVTTGIISLWAYVWMLVVYLWWTPSEVRHAER